jgi:hypothetical protein
MEKPAYSLESSSDNTFYFFESIGEKSIKKAIGYIPFEDNPTIVELVFGDLTDTYSIDFMTVSDNQDMQMVISTVIKSVKYFLEKYPDKIIYFRGSTPARTRLYRAVIAKNLDTTELFYDVLGILENEQSEPFNKSNSYIGYLIVKK